MLLLTFELDIMSDLSDGELGKTVTRVDLADAVYRRVGLSRTEAAKMVEIVLGAICVAAERGENVKISSFGTFAIRDKRQRVGRNPKTGEEVPITPRRVMTFKPSHILKRRINERPDGRAK